MTNNNDLLGVFEMSGIAPASRGVPQIEVSLQVDYDGILQVSAFDMARSSTEKLAVSSFQGRLSLDDIERMIKEAENFAEEDKKTQESGPIE